MKHAVLDTFAGTGVGVAIHSLGQVEHGVENMPEAIASREAAGFMTPYTDAWDSHLAGELNFETKWSSPPCQPFSLAGSGEGRLALDAVLSAIKERVWESMDGLKGVAESFGDARTGLVIAPLNYVHLYMPMFATFEQVPAVLPVWEGIAVEMRGMGYSVWVGIISSEVYGVPQVRKRAYLIARRDGKKASPPPATHARYNPHSPREMEAGVKPWVSMFEAIGWGLKAQPSPTLTSHLGVTRSPSGTQGVYERAIASGEFVFKTVEPVFSPVARNGIGSRFAPNTVNVSTDEGAMLQSYPSGFPFRGSKTRQDLQVGNAVPPLVAKAVLEELWS